MATASVGAGWQNVGNNDEGTTHVSDAITVYGTTWCGDCLRAKRLLDAQGVRYTWIDVDKHPEAEEAVLRLNRGMRSVPTILFPDGSVLVEPSNRELLARLMELKGQEEEASPMSNVVPAGPPDPLGPARGRGPAGDETNPPGSTPSSQ